MAIFEVELPTGEVLEIEAPDDTPEEAIRQRAQAYRMERAGVQETSPVGSDWENFAAGAGKAAVDAYRGTTQLAQSLPTWIRPAGLIQEAMFPGQQEQQRADMQAQIDEAKRLDAPLMSTRAGLGGNILGNIAMTAIPASKVSQAAQAGGILGRLGAGAATGGLLGAAQPVSEGESRAVNTALGAALGGAGEGVGMAGGRLLGGALSRLRGGERRLAEGAQQAGIPLSAADMSGGRFLRYWQSTADELPFSGSGARAEAQRGAFNRQVTRAIGEDAPLLTPDVFSRASTRVGGEFEKLAGRNILRIDRPLVDKLAGIRAEAERLAGPDVAKSVSANIDDLVGKASAKGSVPGRAYQSLDSRLGKQMAAGGEKSVYLGEVREAVREAMDRSITKADKSAWQTAREQWRRLKQLEPLVAKEAGGGISPVALMGRVTADRAGKRAMARGEGGPLGELAQIGQRYLREPPNSGTAGRLLAQRVLGYGTLAGLGGAAAYQDPSNAIYPIAAGWLAPRALRSGLLARGAPAAIRALPAYSAPATAGLLPLFGDGIEEDALQSPFR